MYLTNVHDLPVQPARAQLGLALKVQLRCNKFTRGPSGSLAGRGNAAHTIKITTGIPAIPNVVFVRESFCVAGAVSLPMFVHGRYCTGKVELNRAAFSHARCFTGPGWDPSCVLA